MRVAHVARAHGRFSSGPSREVLRVFTQDGLVLERAGADVDAAEELASLSRPCCPALTSLTSDRWRSVGPVTEFLAGRFGPMDLRKELVGR
ncbi:hypothetical protein [Streptomyces sp. NPDC059165]|uniref:hypothetical protein n=1 Tax=Streptomyces sp. NPDC059165 TaxID=3346751 RepID=UPI0036917440